MEQILFLTSYSVLVVSFALAHLQLMLTIIVELRHWSWGFIGRPHLTCRRSSHGEAVVFPLSRPPTALI